MAEILLAKFDASLSDQDREVLRRALFGVVDGVDERNRKAWRRFWNGALRKEVGECFSVRTWFPRNGRFHRLHFALEQAVFEAQERFTDFDSGFRPWLKIGAGHVRWLPGPRGGVIPVPLSISYAELDDEAMSEFHGKVIAFLREARPQKVLWPHLAPEKREAMMESILSEFDR